MFQMYMCIDSKGERSMLDMLGHACNPSTWDLEAGGLGFGHPQTHREFVTSLRYMRPYLSFK